jgi:hypothetical protein
VGNLLVWNHHSSLNSVGQPPQACPQNDSYLGLYLSLVFEESNTLFYLNELLPHKNLPSFIVFNFRVSGVREENKETET